MGCSRTAAVGLLLMAACTVPDIHIDEAPRRDDGGSAAMDDSLRSAVQPSAQAGAGEGGAGVTAVAVAPTGGAAPAQADAGDKVEPPPLAAGGAGAGGAGSPAPASAGAVGAEGMAGAARGCAVWVSVNTRDDKAPANSVEGGLETIAGNNTKLYVCRARPNGSSYAEPGKYVVGLGCYVAHPVAGQVVESITLDGRIDVLTAAPGCSFSWRSASSAKLPAEVMDLGDPAGGHKYACRASYLQFPSTGIEVGMIVEAPGSPAKLQCWFQSFSGVTQPTEPERFEVLSLEPT